MDEMDLFRDFNRGAAAPSGDARRRAFAIVMGAIEGELTQGDGRLAPVRSRRGGIALAFAALAGVAVAALFVSAPWQDSPGFLERAQAAFTGMKPSILHMKFATNIPDDCGHPTEFWQDQASPHRYRVLSYVPSPLDIPPVQPKPVCRRQPLTEFGGRRNPASTTLEFQPPNRLVASGLKATFPLDPVADLREAIGAGRAHDEGTTELNGRTVRRIRFDPPASCPDIWPDCGRLPTYFYVDTETFYPVAIEGPVFFNSRVLQVKTRFLKFEYLPRTAENFALTDIRAQHPNAIRP